MGFTYMKDRYSNSDYKEKSYWSDGKKKLRVKISPTMIETIHREFRI
jgi:hypothetical protein